MKQYKPRDKITQKMSRDGLTEQNQTTGETERISRREQDADFQSPNPLRAMAVIVSALPKIPFGSSRNFNLKRVNIQWGVHPVTTIH